MAGRKYRLPFLGVAVLGVVVCLLAVFSELPQVLQLPGPLVFVCKVGGALAGVLPVVMEIVWPRHPPPNPRPADTLVDSLALAVRAQWRKEAAKRKLSPPEPIPIGWSLTNLAITGPVEAAVGDPEVPPAFSPLPDQMRITKEQLRAGGGRAELFAVYAGIVSGRVVVEGAPGAGKTGSAILLVLDALEHRDRVDAKNRAKVPVPVLFTAHGWDPTTCSARDWLASRLVATYPLLQHSGGQAEAAELIDAGDIALILDGLDQMDVARRRDALQALSDAPFRVVVFTRREALTQAATWLAGAIGLHLHNVSGPEAADYLQRARTGQPPVGWPVLLTHLREKPDNPLTQALSTPLALTLIRDTYQSGDDISELLNVRQNTGVDLEKRLIGRVLIDAYTFHPGRPKPRYSLPEARQTLAFLARHMHQENTHDLGWWHIPRWAPTTPRILISMIAVGLLGGILGAILYALAPTPDSLTLTDKMLLGLMIGFGVGITLGLEGGRGGHEPKRVRAWRGISLRSVVVAGLAYGFAAGLLMLLVTTGLTLPFSLLLTDPSLAAKWGNWLGGAVVAILVGLPLGLRDLLGGLGDRQDGLKEQKNRRNNRVAVLVAAIVVALAAGVVLPSKLDAKVLVGTVVLLAVWLVVWLMPRIANKFVTRSAESQDNPQGPLGSWRNDRVFGLMTGLTFGLAGGLGYGLGTVLGNVLVDPKDLYTLVRLGLMYGLAFGLTMGLVCGITASATWATTLAWRLQLPRSRHIPTIGLMSFLEDARDRDVLRTLGAFYQFRHAILQDQLAGRTNGKPDHLLSGPAIEAGPKTTGERD